MSIEFPITNELSQLDIVRKYWLNKERNKQYRHQQYHTNSEFRERTKKYNREKYVPKSIRCTKCFKKSKFENLISINFQYDKEAFVCPLCFL